MSNQTENSGQGNWIKLSREILDWEWYSEPNTFRVFVDLLLNAQYKDTRYRGNFIKRGQLITSVDAIKQRTGLSVQNIRTALNNLQSTGEINKQSNKQFTLITICKYDTYQDNSEEGNKPTNNQVTINQQTSNKQVTIYKKDKEGKEREEGKEIDADSLRSSAIRPTAGESAFSEKEGQQAPSEPQGLSSYQPQPVKAPEFQMSQQSLSNNEDNAFGIVEVFDRLKLYLPEGFSLDKNQQSFIRTEYFKVANPNRKQGTFRKQNGDLWDLYGFTEWMAKLLREQGVPTSDRPSVKPTTQSGNATQLRASDIFSMNGHTGTEGGMDLIRKLGGKIL